tara:strand:- start:21 stop:368 length:348 start_codon:yes stop_codon:yes gene_type:complete
VTSYRNPIRTSLKDFGVRELQEAGDILQTLYTEKDLTRQFGVPNEICFNWESGMVFITDEDYNVAALCDNKLEDWIICDDCGHENYESQFKLETIFDDNIHKCTRCKEIQEELTK